MKKITTYIYIDKNENLKLRKQSYALDEGEIKVKLTVKIPTSFYKKREAILETEVTIPEDKFELPFIVAK